MPAHHDARDATVIVTLPERPLDGLRRVLVRIGGEESFIACPAFFKMGASVSVVPQEDGWALACWPGGEG